MMATRDMVFFSASGEAGPVRHSGAGLAFRMRADGPRPCIHDPASAPLASLAGGALARRFQSWRGASGRRHVFTVHEGSAGEWPDYCDAVLLLALRERDGSRRMVMACESGPAAASRLAAAWESVAAFGRANLELHVHLLAETPQARRALLSDLGMEAVSN